MCGFFVFQNVSAFKPARIIHRKNLLCHKLHSKLFHNQSNRVWFSRLSQRLPTKPKSRRLVSDISQFALRPAILEHILQTFDAPIMLKLFASIVTFGWFAQNFDKQSRIQKRIENFVLKLWFATNNNDIRISIKIRFWDKHSHFAWVCFKILSNAAKTIRSD